MDVAQPDLMRNGVGETLAIATLASAHHVPVALHTGVVTAVGMAASWQVAAALPNFLVQEFQPVMLETFGHLVEEGLTAAQGCVQVPTGPGLGVTVDEERVGTMAATIVEIKL
jgi:galactonate dehydratase